MSIQFHSNRAAIEDAFQKSIDRALEICGGTAENHAKTNLTRNRSVITGNLRNSITHEQADEKTEAIGTNVYYAPYVELGTRRSRAKPYLRPAVENHRAEYIRIIETELKG
jgi:HK97 gp10 family phage protein